MLVCQNYGLTWERENVFIIHSPARYFFLRTDLRLIFLYSRTTFRQRRALMCWELILSLLTCRNISNGLFISCSAPSASDASHVLLFLFDVLKCFKHLVRGQSHSRVIQWPSRFQNGGSPLWHLHLYEENKWQQKTTFEHVLFTSSTGEIIPKKPESEFLWEKLRV